MSTVTDTRPWTLTPSSMTSSSRSGPLFVWACLPEQPDLAGVYTALAGIGCDNISFVSDLSRIPLSIREDSPLKETPVKDSPTPSLRPASSHTASDSSCSRSDTPPSTSVPLYAREPASPVKSEPSSEVDHRQVVEECSQTPDDDSDEPATMVNLHALASFWGAQAHSMLGMQGPPQTAASVVSEESIQSEPSSSVDLSFLRNVSSGEGKEKNVTCQICEKSFSRNARNVSRHAATHFPRAAARYTCGKCGEAFGRNDRAKYHVDTKHNGNAELHDKAKDSEYSDEWVRAVKQCFPGFDFSPRDTHARNPDSSTTPLDVTAGSNGRVKVQCKLCSWMLFPCSPTAFAIEHAVQHCPPQFTCSLCGEQSDNRENLQSHCLLKHSGKAQVIDSASTGGDDRLREFTATCFPSRMDDMEKAFEDRARLGAKKRRIDSLIESKKKAMKMG